MYNESLPQWQLHDNYKVKQELCIGPLGIYKNKALDNEPSKNSIFHPFS
jgi:hypothetical protein